jgi:general secretion pathway protein D
LAYQIGTRTANTTLQLRDGETQILAGLIKNEDINSKSRVPGLSAIPGLGRLFVNENNTHKKSELVLLITPRIVRNIQRPDAYASEFYSGTKDRFSLSLPAIGPQARYSRESLSDPVADENQRSEISSSASEEIISSATASKITSQAPQLNLSAPRSIDGGQTFSTTIALDAAVKAETNFLLSYEAAALELLSITPLTQRAELKYTNNPGQIDFTLTSTNFARESDILATVSFKAKSTDTERTTTLELNSASDEKLAAPPLNGISHQLQITPVVLDGPGSTDNAIDASAVNP